MEMNGNEKKSFLAKIRKFIQRENLPTKDAKALLAISGGLDSMVLAHVLPVLGFTAFELAHVNFGLRGMESDLDEKLVVDFAEKQGLALHLKKAEKNFFEKKSIQDAARAFRYAWFEDLATSNGFEIIFLAHHADDQAETVLHHFFRGSGVSGLRGMLPQNGKYVRPLLEVSKSELLQFALSEGITWREDASNQKLVYTRNKIRLQLMPQIQSLFPGFEKVLLRNARRFKRAEKALKSRFLELEESFFLFSFWDGRAYDFTYILNAGDGHFFLEELLNSHGFTWDVLDSVLSENVQNETRIWKSAQGGILEVKSGILWIWEKEFHPLNLEINRPGNFILDKEKAIALQVVENGNWQLPADFNFLGENEVLAFPLILRNWKSGDKMVVRSCRKKISDLLTEQKLSQMQKNRSFVLESENATVVGLLFPNSSTKSTSISP
jgi:tRNA(Ile)-lysidine synthase